MAEQTTVSAEELLVDITMELLFYLDPYFCVRRHLDFIPLLEK